MNTKRLPFQASTLCAGGTLLVLGGFLALNLAGCGGGGGGGLVTPTPIPGTTPSSNPVSIVVQLELADGSAATGGGTVNLTSATGTGRTYSFNSGSKGIVNLKNIVPDIYTVVFTVKQINGTTVTTTRSLTVTSPTAAQIFKQGDTGDSKPFTISGRILLNPAGMNDPDGNSSTSNCDAVVTPVTDAVTITVRDLNSTNGNSIIATMSRPAQPSSTSGTQRGLYSISIPYQPRSYQVVVTGANDAPFAGLSATTSFPAGTLSVSSIDICTNASSTPPQPGVTPTPSPTPFATPTTVGTPEATATSTPVTNPTNTPTPVPTSTPVPTATTAPTNTPVPGSPTNTPAPTPTNTPTG